jgi:integrase
LCHTRLDYAYRARVSTGEGDCRFPHARKLEEWRGDGGQDATSTADRTGGYRGGDKAGVRRICFHDLRHSTATLLIDRGDPLVDVSQLLGHADIRTTANIYTDWTGVKAARVVQHMDEILTNDHQVGVKMGGKQ